MTQTISITDAESRLRELLKDLQPGQEIIILDGEEPVAKLLPYAPKRTRPGPGLCQGMITIVADDDDHLKDFEEYMP